MLDDFTEANGATQVVPGSHRYRKKPPWGSEVEDAVETLQAPAGSVGIVENFCNIYPYESPGGWNIIGRTPTKLFNIQKESNPCLLSPGDSVKFKLISKEEFEKLANVCLFF